MLLAGYTIMGEMGLQSLARPLSAYRQGKLAQLRNPAVIRQGIAAERLLEHLLSRVFLSFTPPVELIEDENGKPQLPDSWALHMNLSHSGPYAACVLADHPVGIDVQERTACKERLVRRCLTEKEQAFLYACPDPDRSFTLLWALKESYIKLSGQGLRMGLNSFSIELFPESCLAACPGAAFSYVELEDAALAICVPEGCEPRPPQWERIRLD